MPNRWNSEGVAELPNLCGGFDVVDASVVAEAIRCRAVIVTGDVADMDRLAAAAGGGVGVFGF